MINVETPKNKFDSIFTKIKGPFVRFPLTTIAVILVTFIVLTMFIVDIYYYDYNKMQLFTKCMYFVVLFGIGSFFIEAFFTKSKKQRIIFYIVDSIISLAIIAFTVELELNMLINSNFNNKIIDLISRIIIYYIFFLVTSAIFCLYKKSGKSIEEYVFQVFSNCIKTTFVYIALSIGFSIISSIFIELIAGDYELLFILEIILFGIYYVPSMIYNFADIKDEVSGFIKTIVKYVFASLIFIAFIIIYVYMIKIFALKEKPSNQIFRILSFLFVCGLPIWTIMHSFKEERSLWQSIFNKMPIIFIPFIFLQIDALNTRIQANGITPLRYIGIMFIIFEVIYILLYIFKRGKIGNMILLPNVLLVIAIFIPGVNMFTLSNISQAKRLEVYTQKVELSSEEKADVYGAYLYLSGSENGEEYINNILNSDDVEQIEAFSENYYASNYDYYYSDEDCCESEYDSYIYISAYAYDEVINIKDYTKLYNVNSIDDFGNIETVFEKVKLVVPNTSTYKVMEINLSKKMKDYIEQYSQKNENDFKEYFENNNEIILDDTRKLIFTTLYITYDKDTQMVESYNLNGYLLEK